MAGEISLIKSALFQPFTPKPVDPFYSPILSKLDQIFLQLGHPDESCRERLVCNMYKTPTQYSPHSNYVSAELSRYVITSRHSKPILPLFEQLQRLVGTSATCAIQSGGRPVLPVCASSTRRSRSGRLPGYLSLQPANEEKISQDASLEIGELRIRRKTRTANFFPLVKEY